MGIGSFIGGVVGFMVAGPPGAAVGAAAGGTKQGEAVVNAAGKAISSAANVAVEVVEGFGEVVWVGAVAVVDAVGDVAKSAYNLVHGTVAFRSLRQTERALLVKVYGASVPLDRIVICSIIGISNRPLTLPGSMLAAKSFMLPGIGPALSIYALIRGLADKYVLCLGMEGYNRGLSMPFDTVRAGQTLVHETMHVWQGDTGAWPWGYVYDSVISQCTCGIRGIDAYSAIAGQQFHEYNVEQQARLVENWFCGAGTDGRRAGMAVPNADAMKILDVYMEQVVRQRRPNANVTIPTTTNVGTTTSALKMGDAAKLGPGVLPGVARPAAALTSQQLQQYRQTAEALSQQAKALRATNNPVLIAQAQSLEQQAAQYRTLGGVRLSSIGVAGPASQLLRR
jgi:hypothetical protein